MQRNSSVITSYQNSSMGLPPYCSSQCWFAYQCFEPLSFTIMISLHSQDEILSLFELSWLGSCLNKACLVAFGDNCHELHRQLHFRDSTWKAFMRECHCTEAILFAVLQGLFQVLAAWPRSANCSCIFCCWSSSCDCIARNSLTPAASMIHVKTHVTLG